MWSYFLRSVRRKSVLKSVEDFVHIRVPRVENRISHGGGRIAHRTETFLKIQNDHLGKGSQGR